MCRNEKSLEPLVYVQTVTKDTPVYAPKLSNIIKDKREIKKFIIFKKTFIFIIDQVWSFV